jgi:ABC-2 type transport system ATP-binding protein
MPERADPTPSLLCVRGLAKSYGPRAVLEAVSFTVRPGEVLGLIGPNGAGKTTLFECLAGLLPADAGEVHGAGGRRLAPAARGRELFYVPDGIAPWADQPAGHVLAFFRDLWGVAADRFAATLDSLKLAPLLATAVGALSKGERKRFLLATGLLAPQPLLLLDEPFDGLDLRQTREAMEVLRREVAAGRTLFLSIHQLLDAARACDRFVLLAAGRVAGEGTLAELEAAAGIGEIGGAGRRDLEEVFLALT